MQMAEADSLASRSEGNQELKVAGLRTELQTSRIDTLANLSLLACNALCCHGFLACTDLDKAEVKKRNSCSLLDAPILFPELLFLGIYVQADEGYLFAKN